jgi:hypothetical protein
MKASRGTEIYISSVNTFHIARLPEKMSKLNVQGKPVRNATRYHRALHLSETIRPLIEKHPISSAFMNPWHNCVNHSKKVAVDAMVAQ